MRDEIEKKEYKSKHKYFQKRTKDWCMQALLYTYKNEKKNFFHKQKNSVKRKENLNNFNNRNTIAKIRLSSHSFAINTSKWYNLEEDMKICKNCEKK